jgi:hypothetical protein
MAVSKSNWDKALRVLERFERHLIDPREFNWDYIVEVTGISKATLWRNEEFREEHQRVKNLVNGYINGVKEFDLEFSIQEAKLRERDKVIEELKEENAHLKRLLNIERERLAYAAILVRRRNIDPEEFMEKTPLTRKVGNKVTPIIKTKK